jgi:hypothetical protein
MTSELAHIKLIKGHEVLSKISQDNSLWSIVPNPPMSSSHARNKIAELKCLKSVYAPEFTFYLIGEYGVDNNFLVHRICITCDEISNSQHNKRIHESF